MRRARLGYEPGAVVLLVLLISVAPRIALSQTDILRPGFDDTPLQHPVQTPAWFKTSFLDLREDLEDARRSGKSGLLLYFGQKYCPYCKVLLERDFARGDIKTYTQRRFDVVAIGTRGSRLVTGFDGSVLPESEYAARHRADLTPTLVFYDTDGNQALRLIGYHPPYELRAALEYAADGHYRRQRFREYLARGEPALHGEGELTQEAYFAPPPYALDRSRFGAQRPLVVMFEQPECHACDVLHVGALQSERTRRLLEHFDVIQLNMLAPTPVITPAGQRTSAEAWAEQLGLYYAPTLVFYDQEGREIIRLDSVVHFNRLRSVLRYVLDQGYTKYRNYQDWRAHQEPAPASS